ncbi:pectate lyase [Aphelenchoides avenae]|nr:pectate lyase [Aphelenchus avenae]
MSLFSALSVALFVAAAPHFGTAQFASWPSYSGKPTTVEKTIEVKTSYDGKMVRHVAGKGLGDGGQDESQKELFKLEDGASIRNVIIGSPAADGIHCKGSCTIENVWWEDVGEDAATFKGKSDAAKYNVIGGGARKASDKVFQHNGAGTLTIKNFQVEDFGKLYRSCGNCGTQYKRTVILDTVRAKGPGKSLVGINYNYGDSATLRNVQVSGAVKEVCSYYEGNNKGKEPPVKGQFAVGQDGDGQYCKYKKSDVKQV